MSVAPSKTESTHVVHDILLAKVIYLLLGGRILVSNHLCTNIKVRTAAVSTPVGPPPQTTKLSRRFRSSGVVVGRLAVSKLSDSTVGYSANVNHVVGY